MPSDAWWAAQERLHRRLEAANAISDDDKRHEKQRQAWDSYNRERENDRT